MVLFCITEKELPTDDARDAVEVGDRQIFRATETRTTHEGREADMPHKINSFDRCGKLRREIAVAW